MYFVESFIEICFELTSCAASFGNHCRCPLIHETFSSFFFSGPLRAHHRRLVDAQGAVQFYLQFKQECQGREVRWVTDPYKQLLYVNSVTLSGHDALLDEWSRTRRYALLHPGVNRSPSDYTANGFINTSYLHLLAKHVWTHTHTRAYTHTATYTSDICEICLVKNWMSLD